MEQFTQWLQEQTGIPYSNRNEALRRHLADKLGYSNRTKSLRRIDALLQRAEINDELHDRLASALQVSKDVVAEKVSDARTEYFYQQREEYFSEHGPELIAIAPKPSQISFAGFFNAKRYVALPVDLPERSEAEQINFLQSTIADFITRVGTFIPLFGHISGFAYANSPHTHWQLDLEGGLIAKHNKPAGISFSQEKTT